MVIENGNTICDDKILTNDSIIPHWLHQCFVEMHLRNYFKNENLKIVNFTVAPATAPGENYASDLYRVNVTFTDCTSGSSTKNEVS